PLALKGHQLRNRGWTDGLIRRFLGDPDATQPRQWWDSLEPLYAAERVQRVEATAAFKEALTRLEPRRAAARAAAQARAAAAQAKAAAAQARAAAERAEAPARWEAWLEERQREKARREEARRATFPGFLFEAQRSPSRVSVHVCIGVDHGPNTSAHVQGVEVCALVEGCEKTRFWAPLLDWLLEHAQVGNRRFRAALGFLAVSDPEGWRTSHESRPMEREA